MATAILNRCSHSTMAGDKDTLLGMGFDPARVECKTTSFSLSQLVNDQKETLLSSGALKATSNRGLQPAMDHILENEGNAVPDLSSVSSSSTGAAGRGGGDAMDEDDEDAEALKSLAGKSAADLEAKVWSIAVSFVTFTNSFSPPSFYYYFFRASNVQSVARFSEIRLSPTSTRRNRDMTNLKSLQRRFVVFTDGFSRERESFLLL
jgi:hypothetical protein